MSRLFGVSIPLVKSPKLPGWVQSIPSILSVWFFKFFRVCPRSSVSFFRCFPMRDLR